MKKNYFVIIACLFCVQLSWSQSFITNQVLMASGGNFNDPSDFVTLSTYNPSELQLQDFGSVMTQSVQHLVIDGHYAYVAAQDSLALFDINTYQRLAVVEAIGVRHITVYEDQLIVSFWYPVLEGFVKLYSSADLTLLATIDGLSGDAAVSVVKNQTAYVAIPGAWGSTVGKIARINLQAMILIDEIDLGETAVNINDIYLLEGEEYDLMAICPTPYGASSGSIVRMNSSNNQTQVSTYDLDLGRAVAIHDGQLYNRINNGLGIIDLEDMSISDSALFVSPAFGFSGLAMDTLNGLFYTTTTDYVSSGQAYIYGMDGSLQDSFECGIDANSIAMDYRSTEAVSEDKLTEMLNVYPNPAKNVLHLQFSEETSIEQITLINLQGVLMKRYPLQTSHGLLSLDVSELTNGMYYLLFEGQERSFTKPFVKY